jgi:hypothetical protein
MSLWNIYMNFSLMIEGASNGEDHGIDIVCA